MLVGSLIHLQSAKNAILRIRVDKELEKVGVAADEKMSEAELNRLFDEKARRNKMR